MPKAGISGPQHPLAEHAAMGVHERESGVIADCADVAEVVGEALELRHESAQPDRASWRLGFAGGLGRSREGICVSDGGVAGGAAGEARAVREVRACHQSFDALVNVAETFLKPHYCLAVSGEPEVAGLNNAGVNRADRDLVQAGTFGG